MINIELKARLRDRLGAERVCGEIGAAFSGVIRQRDVYFPVGEGRFKLRISEPPDHYLVYYRRADVLGAKRCDYTLTRVEASIEPVLRDALGVLAVVEKERTLHMWENVRIHLDRVAGLGDFLEFEAVLQDETEVEKGHRQLAWLQEKFVIEPGDLFEKSYLELTIDLIAE